MFTCFLFQAICYPLSNLMSHHRSVQKSYMLGIAWILSILFGIPQLFIYRTPDDRDVCFPKFYPNWGKQVSNFSLFIYVKKEVVVLWFILWYILYFTHQISILICQNFWDLGLKLMELSYMHLWLQHLG